MKTLKKALSVILGLAIMLSCVMGMQVSVAAEGTVAVSVGEATVADGVVTVPVVATGSLQAFTVTVDYDNTVLTLADAEKVALPDVEDSAVFGPTDAETFKMMWAFALEEADVVLDNTQIATLTFNVVDEAAEATDITLTVTEAWDVAGNEVAATAGVNNVTLKTEPAGPVIDDTLVVAGAAPGYGTSSLQVNFRIRNNILTKYNDMELVIIPDKYDLTTLNLVETPEEIVVPYAQLSGTGTFRTYLYTDVQLYELGLTIKYMLRGTDAEGNAVQSPVYETSIASYLKNLYAGSTDTYFRTLLVDTLVVGDAAARNMAAQYADSDLAKAASIIDGFDTSEATPSVDSYNTIDVHNATDAEWGTASGTHKVARSIVIEKVPSISYRIRGGSSIDLDKMSVTVSYTQVAGDGTETPYSRTFTSADTANIYKSGSFLMFKFGEIGLQDGDKDLTIVANYDGAEVFNAKYSIESYLGLNMSDATIGDLCTAIIKLGISFRAFSAQ